MGATVGAILEATAHGIGDVAPLPATQRRISGESLRPPSPCHVTIRRDGAALSAEWVRRSHRGWAWIDGVGDAEDGFPELYRAALTGPGGAIEIETAARSASWGLAELPAQPGEQVNLSVVAIGPQAISRRARATIIL